MTRMRAYELGGKLVRDNIVALTHGLGGNAIADTVEGVNKNIALIAKIKEEADEIDPDAVNPEEVADIIEAALELGANSGYSAEEIEAIRQQKLIEKGGFATGTIVHVVEVPEGSDIAKRYAEDERYDEL